MRYQALILIFIILISAFVLKESSVFSENSPATVVGQQAIVSNSINSTSDLQGIENISGGANEKQTTSQENKPTSLIADVVEAPSVSQDEPSQEQTCDGVNAKIYVVKSLSDGSVLFERGTDSRWPIASITKVMTAVVAMENMNLSTVLPISSNAIQTVQGYDASTSLVAGEKYTVQDLVKAALSFSSNEATYALAEGMGSDAFVAKMNQKAKEIGMNQTSFVEPSGLSYLNQSNVNDLYSLMTYAYRNYPMILDITRKKSVSLREMVSGKTKTFSNIDYFAGQTGFVGGKTGYIDQSGENLVTLFQKNAKMYFTAVLSSPDRFGETQKLYSCIK